MSLATASRVLNGSTRKVAESYRERVDAAAEKLGYTANLSAQATARGTSAIVALLVADIGDVSFGRLASGVVRGAEEAGFIVTIADTGRGWQGIDKVSQEVYELIGTPKGSFTASPDDVTSGHKLANLSGAFPDRVKKWALDSGNLAKIGGVHPGGVVAVVALLVTIGWVLIGRLMLPSMWAMEPAAFAAFGLGLLGAGAATRRTSKGRELWSRVGGFYRLLSTTSAQERFDFAGRNDLYTAYLPWAVAFGCADTWAEKFRTETGTEPPVPEYFFGAGGASLSGSSIDSLVDSFDSSVSSAISSYEATQVSSSSGSSGFSGGGFSGGGGGGGGGGGSW